MFICFLWQIIISVIPHSFLRVLQIIICQNPLAELAETNPGILPFIFFYPGLQIVDCSLSFLCFFVTILFRQRSRKLLLQAIFLQKPSVLNFL